MKKRIGIITYHKAYNFGSVLQAYALNRYLRDLGHDVETIDFQTEKQANLYTLFEPVNSMFSIARNLQSVRFLRSLRLRRKRFDDFLREFIPTSETVYFSLSDLNNADLDYDLFICGSDQIWNPNCQDFDEAYLLAFVKDKTKCIAYAPSIASHDINPQYHSLFRSQLKDFESLSVREISGAAVISKIIGREPTVVLDPVFLLDADKWRKLITAPPVKQKYIFCYFIGDVAGMRHFARKMRKATGLPLVVVYKNIRDELYRNIKIYSAGPVEFLSLIAHAEYICTNSFHAVAFSIIFKKKFWVFIDDANVQSSMSRIVDFTRMTGLENRVLTAKKCEVKFDEVLDYSLAQQTIKREIQNSADYIVCAINDF